MLLVKVKMHSFCLFEKLLESEQNFEVIISCFEKFESVCSA